MKIYSKDDKIIAEIDKWQNWEDAAGQPMGKVMNVVGVIAGDFEQGIYQAIELGYKDDVQLGMPLIMTDRENGEFRELCKKLGIQIWEYPACDKCKKTIWGSFTANKDYDHLCRGCEYKLEEEKL